MECAANSLETFTSPGRTLCVTPCHALASLPHGPCIPETVSCSLLKMLEGKSFPYASVGAPRGKVRVRVSSREPRNPHSHTARQTSHEIHWEKHRGWLPLPREKQPGTEQEVDFK